MQVFGVAVEEDGLDVANRELCTQAPLPTWFHMIRFSLRQQEASDSAVYHLHGYFQSSQSQVYSRYKDWEIMWNQIHVSGSWMSVRPRHWFPGARVLSKCLSSEDSNQDFKGYMEEAWFLSILGGDCLIYKQRGLGGEIHSPALFVCNQHTVHILE